MFDLKRFSLISVLVVSSFTHADYKYKNKTSILIDLPISTQGPFWPPSEALNADGDYLLLGTALLEKDGQVGTFPEQALLISKDTVPPLDANGIEEPDDWFSAPYSVIRPLDLSKGSPDLDTVIYSSSFGPFDTVDGAPRIPAAGDSQYNLNKDLVVCRDTFPTDSQLTNYFRPAFPLHEVPIRGFQGDGVAYDTNTGEAYDPKTATNDPSCAATGCPGEDVVDERNTNEITLGDWLKFDGKLFIKLKDKNSKGQFTRANFTFGLKDMIPNALYTIWVVRERQIPIPGVYERRDIDPIAIPNILMTDSNGKATGSFNVTNPFPSKENDPTGKRIIGLSIVFHSDYQTWGACFSPLGPGVDAHVVFNTLNVKTDEPGLPDFTDFTTVAP